MLSGRATGGIRVKSQGQLRARAKPAPRTTQTPRVAPSTAARNTPSTSAAPRATPRPARKTGASKPLVVQLDDDDDDDDESGDEGPGDDATAEVGRDGGHQEKEKKGGAEEGESDDRVSFSCGFCPMKFYDRSDWTSHEMGHFNKFPCKTCLALFSSPLTLKRHCQQTKHAM